ncbi:carboxypeptidase-like regulatory domain-containing protein [Candidatus Nitrososphaera sp. FF02]|uniref:carboxypeptidase-like regulatory domain-containing protein n=1 Tax=Candidatus Nitrososphaera sp. FF02 TaxID=3398226 RepID=UPI0039EB7A89
MTAMHDIKGQFAELQKKYTEYLPKVDPALVDDLLLRQAENPSVEPMYMVEVFTRPGLDTESVRRYIIEKTGMSPAIYDDGTHYVTNQKLSIEALKEISDSEDVLEVTGEYTGGLGGYGASHEHIHRRPRNVQEAAGQERAGQPARQAAEPAARGSNGIKIAAFTAAGIIGALVIAGAIISGGMPPNANIDAAPPVQSAPGLVHGYVSGPGGLPAVGTTVIAAGQTTAYHANVFVSVNGQYFIDLPADEYVIIAAYPDGTNKIVTGFAVGEGSDHQLDFSY